jgi:hypothetical protein
MKKNLVLAALIAVFGVGVASADTVIQDFDALTSVAGQWSPTFSGTSSGVSADTGALSTAQANSGTNSVELAWTWDATGGVIRVQPDADLLNAGGGVADRTTEPFTSVAIYGAASGDSIQVYLTDTGYESFVNELPVDFTGWTVAYWNVATSPAVGWITGDGALDITSINFRGVFVKQLAAAGAQVLYFDDFQFTAAAPAGGVNVDTASVSDWSVF